MNYRVLALGVVAGFLIALAPSCGGATCGPANCKGCCDANKKCVDPGNTNQTCGASGNACKACLANETCQAGQCTAGSGGGSGGGGGGSGGGSGGGGGTSTCDSSTCPNGCCSQGLCLPGNAQANCGSGGQACSDCNATTGATCVNKSCQVVDAGSSGNIGEPCNGPADCPGVPTGGQGGPTICKKNQFVLTPTGVVTGTPYQDGYCTRRCYSGTQCGTGYRCGFFMGFAGEAENVCYKGCSAQTDCRAGYICLGPIYNDAPQNLCVPANLPDGGWAEFDAGPEVADGVIGKDCGSNADCQGTSAYGRCNKGTLPDGGPSGFGTGYCTADCTMTAEDSFCGTSDGGTFCTAIAFADGANGPLVTWECRKGCGGDPDGGCKAGYSCGNDVFSQKICEVNCDNTPNVCGSQGCFNSWGCFSSTCNATTHTCQ